MDDDIAGRRALLHYRGTVLLPIYLTGCLTLNFEFCRYVGYGICIETGVACGGWLTCLDVLSGDFWQSNQEGQTRNGKLS